MAQPLFLKAVVLCGGLGTRLSPVLKDRPKTLATVSGRPFLAYLLDQLVAAGFEDAILATGHFGDQVRDAFQDNYRGLRIAYSQETSPLGTGGALRAAAAELDHALDRALVMNGDSWCEADLRSFVQSHFESGALNSMAVTAMEDCRRYGTVEMDAAGAVTAFHEKRAGSDRPLPGFGFGFGFGFINAGIYLLSRALIESIPSDRPVSLEREVFPAWLDGRLQAWQCTGRFIDIGTPESFASADRFFASPRKGIVLLDRDGTINVERHYLSSVEGMELLPGSAEGVRMLNRLGLPVIVISNQTVVARGECSVDMLRAINRRMVELLAEQGAAVDAIYWCPHAPDDNCGCRKPRTGLLDHAAWVFGADLTQSFLVGDKCSDIQAGRAAGAATFLVRTGHGRHAAGNGDCTPQYTVENLNAAAARICRIIQGN